MRPAGAGEVADVPAVLDEVAGRLGEAVAPPPV
jgi:hypothetical protein